MENRLSPKINPSNAKRRVSFVELRARFPYVVRYAAIAALVLTTVLVGAGYWRSRNFRDFRMFGAQPQLSNEVLAVVHGYERRVTEGEKLKMLLRADKETTFADERHELDNVFLEVYPDKGDKPDRVTALKAVYTPDRTNPENFTVSFNGNVNFESRDGLKAITEHISYDKQKEIAETPAVINFSRDNISGAATGAILNVKEKKLELKNQVEINVAPGGNAAKNSLTDFGSSAVKINAVQAGFDQDLAQFELNGGVSIVITPQTPDKAPTTIRAEKAVYNKESQKIDLSGGVEIVAASDNAGGLLNEKAETAIPVFIRATAASYEQANGKVNLSRAASVQQGTELVSGDYIVANLSQQKKLEKVLTKGNAFLRTGAAERRTEVHSAELFAQFDLNQQLNSASATGAVKIKSISSQNEIILSDANSLALKFIPKKDRSLLEKMRTEGNTNVSLLKNNSGDYSRVEMFSPNSLEVSFALQADRSVLKQMQTGGRTEIKMFAPETQIGNPKAANKRLLANSVKLFWNSSGNDLSQAIAEGDAELYIEPLQNAPNLDKQKIFAGSFDCVFYEAANLVRNCAAIANAKAILEPTISSNERSIRTLTADKMAAAFERQSQAAENISANGNAKFNELDRNGIANGFLYSTGDEVVRLRGGEPTVWDGRARVKAAEIDWNTKTEISSLRGRVATTYYSQEQTGGAAPFAKVNSPVFITSNAAEFNYAAGVAVYSGNARAWQENNFVRAEKLILRRDSRSMFGEGKVQSALYNAKRRENGADKIVPVFAASDRIAYSEGEKLLRYESNVDIRQGTERITCGAAEVFLNDANEVAKTVAQDSVVIAQPGRKATGDWAQYVAADEVVTLRGNPALVQDAEQGSSTGKQVTVFLRENRILGQGGATQAAPGRVRSTHKIKKQ